MPSAREPRLARTATRRARFAGLLEGKRTPADAERLRGIAAELSALLPTRADLELDGGRFSLLLSDEEFDARALGPDHEQRFAELLQQLVDASSDPRSVESTLRCTLVAEGEVVETLFAVVQGELRPLSRARPREADDLRAARPAPRSRALLACLLAASLLLLVAWQGGWIERALAPSAASLALDSGPFGELLALSVADRAGNYELSIARGPRYPATVAELDALAAAAVTTVERAAIAAVGAGDPVYAQLRDADGRVLAAAELAPRPLLADAAARASVFLPGRRAAAALHLALDDGLASTAPPRAPRT